MSGSDDGAFEQALRAVLGRGMAGELPRPPEATWAAAHELGPEWTYAPDHAGLLLGYRGPRAIGWNDDRHIVTVAGTRSGKGVSLIIPNLLLYAGSVLTIDPKGELARITARRRRELGQKVVVLDPFGESGFTPSGNFNPLEEINADGKEAVDEAAAVAQALIQFYQGQRERHWTEAAQNLLLALILMTLTFEKTERNLVTVRRLLMTEHPSVDAYARHSQISEQRALFKMMEALGDKFHGVVAGQGRAFNDMSEKEREIVLSEARTQTAFLDSKNLQDTLRKSDFHLADLKRQGVTVYLCLPARYMDSHGRWLRVIINLALIALEPRITETAGTKERKVPPVLLVLEEFPVLRHMEKLSTAAGQLAGSGVKLWVIVQNLGQIEDHYGKGWETFLANSGVVTFHGNADLNTLRYISDKVGQVTIRVVEDSGASSSQLLGGAHLTKEQLRQAPLLATHEAEQLLANDKHARRWRKNGGLLLVLATGEKPVLVERALYFEDKPFRGMFDA